MESDPAPTSEKYKRILLKLSGEVLMGQRPAGIDPDTVARLANEVAEIHRSGVEVCLVIGGGNFFRGMSDVGRQFDRATADTVGMLATVMNGLIFQNALEVAGIETRVMTALEMRPMAEMFIRRRALRHLEKGRVVIFSAGTGHPYFSTDTAAVLRALEIRADAIFKATKVDGVYSADPVKDPSAVRYDHVSFQEVLEKGLAVMDQAAIALCRENQMPLVVFDIKEPGNLFKVIADPSIGTLVSCKGREK